MPFAYMVEFIKDMNFIVNEGKDVLVHHIRECVKE